MYEGISFEEFYGKLKTAFAENGLTPPEDIELIELAHMECIEEETPADKFIQAMIDQEKKYKA